MRLTDTVSEVKKMSHLAEQGEKIELPKFLIIGCWKFWVDTHNMDFISKNPFKNPGNNPGAENRKRQERRSRE